MRTLRTYATCIALFSSGALLMSSSNRNDAVQNPENRAIYFDGIDDYVNLGDVYDDLQLPVTISAWVWLDPNAPSGSIPIIDTQDGLPAYSGISLLTSKTSSFSAQYGDGKGENNAIYRRAKGVNVEPIGGRWVNLTAVVRGAMSMDLYFNGVNVGGSYSGSSGLPMNSNSPDEVAKIGMLIQNGTVLRFKGKLDELRIWNRPLPQAEIQEVIFTRIDKTHKGLIGYWNFDEPTGDILVDQSINRFDGILKGTPARIQSEAPVH